MCGGAYLAEMKDHAGIQRRGNQLLDKNEVGTAATESGLRGVFAGHGIVIARKQVER
jgi:hypothetical protein